jgi:hypothetical protein
LASQATSFISSVQRHYWAPLESHISEPWPGNLLLERRSKLGQLFLTYLPLTWDYCYSLSDVHVLKNMISYFPSFWGCFKNENKSSSCYAILARGERSCYS